MCYEIDISCCPPNSRVDVRALRTAVEYGLKAEDVAQAVLSISVVDNREIHRLNREHLEHDYPTDVISFQLDWTCDDDTLENRLERETGRSRGASIEGEIVVSAQYAEEMAASCGWSVQNELTLYTIHGMLHICGYDDLTAAEKKRMRFREKAILEGLGLAPEYPDDAAMADDAADASSASVSVCSDSSMEDLR